MSEAIYTALQKWLFIGEDFNAKLYSAIAPITEQLSLETAAQMRTAVELFNNPELKALRQEYDLQNRINEILRTPEYIEELKLQSEIGEYLRQQPLEIPKGPREALKTEQPKALEELQKKSRNMKSRGGFL